MAKVVHSESIAITTNPKANQWVEIPHEMIEYIHHIDTSVGEFGKLPFVEVVFKDPPRSNAEATVYAKLLWQLATNDNKDEEIEKLLLLIESMLDEAANSKQGGGGFQPFADKYCDYVCSKCKDWEWHSGKREFWCSRCYGPRCRKA